MLIIYDKILLLFYLKSTELLSLVAGNLCIDEFGQKEFPEKGTLKQRTIEYTSYYQSLITLAPQELWRKQIRRGRNAHHFNHFNCPCKTLS